jgi:hypothetical protein
MASPSDDSSERMVDRRKFVSVSSLVTATLATQLPINYAIAASEPNSFSTFEDDDLDFKVSFPSNWEKSVQSLPDRRKIVLFADPLTASGKDQNLMFIAYTPVRDDFTSLSSFGSADEVARKTILPKGELVGQESDSNLLSAESKKNSYYFDYTSKVPDQPERHFRTIFTLIQGGTGGAGAVLVSLTAQSTVSNYSNMKESYDMIIESFGKK